MPEETGFKTSSLNTFVSEDMMINPSQIFNSTNLNVLNSDIYLNQTDDLNVQPIGSLIFFINANYFFINLKLFLSMRNFLFINK